MTDRRKNMAFEVALRGLWENEPHLQDQIKINSFVHSFSDVTSSEVPPYPEKPENSDLDNRIISNVQTLYEEIFGFKF